MDIVKQSLSDELFTGLNQLSGESFFASSGFLNLWKTINGKPVYWLAKLDNKIVAAMPGVEFGINPIKRFQASPDGCYASIRFDSNLLEEQKNEVIINLEEALLKAGYIKLFIFDYSKKLTQFSKMNKNILTTQLIDLSTPNWEPPDKKIQSEIRKAQREGVTVIPFDKEKHFDKFISLMEQTEQRHNRSPKYPPEFYNALAELAKIDKRIIWHWCEYDNKPVTAHINFADGEMLLNWQVFFDKQFSFLKANQFILYHTAQNWIDAGGKYLNLGASPDDASDLKKYKSKYGAIDYNYPAYTNKKLIGKLL